jgi:lysophospholipase L1-like esterase
LKRISSLFQSEPNTNGYSYYVGLGDSISTDDYPGEDRGAISLLYKNQDELYPNFRGRDLRSIYPGIKFQSLALDGATTAHVLHHQLEKIKAPHNQRSLFTLTAGGNDILSGEDAEDVVNRLEIIVKTITRNFPQSDLIIGTIYDPTDGVLDLFEDGRDITREYEILKIVNARIEEFGKNSNVRVVDIYSHFLGHGSHCKDPNNPHHKKEDSSLWYVLTIEPNSRGAHEVRRLFWKALHPDNDLIP